MINIHHPFVVGCVFFFLSNQSIHLSKSVVLHHNQVVLILPFLSLVSPRLSSHTSLTRLLMVFVIFYSRSSSLPPCSLPLHESCSMWFIWLTRYVNLSLYSIFIPFRFIHPSPIHTFVHFIFSTFFLFGFRLWNLVSVCHSKTTWCCHHSFSPPPSPPLSLCGCGGIVVRCDVLSCSLFHHLSLSLTG
jgi:hypothetical protein